MMSNGGYQDRILTCRDCGQEFTFSAGEQEFFASRNLTNQPGRCPSCRAARRNAQLTAPHSHTVEHYETTCADCGRPTSVPFVPRQDRPVYCNDCYQSHRPARKAYSYSGSRGQNGRDRYNSGW